MHQPRKTRTHRWRSPATRGVLAGLVVAAIAAFGLPAPALSAPSTTKVDVRALCGTPRKGEAACFAMRRTDIKGGQGIRPAVTPDGYGPGDLLDAYNLPAGSGAGQTVAIVDAFDDPNAEADLAVYRAQYGLPACTSADGCFRKVDQRGGTAYPDADSDWSGEISLDLDMVSAIVPLAHIVLVEADTTSGDDLFAAVDQAVAQGARYVSNSWGTGYDSTPGSGEDPAEVTDWDTHFNHPGVAVVASTGDGDYGVSYPAVSPFVTAVGGTSLVRDTSSRGFGESVWHNGYGGPGSGCSVYEPKPAFQTDTGCDMRTISDVSAVADPATGVAVYDSYGDGGGWGEYGGTSASSPIIAGVYAAAGTPAAGTYPNRYPYARTSALYDITSGSNGSCTPAYLCTAGAGYDGPTGLGTPNGLTAFTSGPTGTITGTVTDSATGAPLAGATVTAGDGSAQSDAAGHYSLTVAVGTYDVTASAYAYGSSTKSNVDVADGATVTEDFALAPVPSATVSGTVTDGSGHGWPLYAKLTVDGVPGGPVFTDPYTGHYSLDLPQGKTYQVHVTANYPGYQPVDVAVPVGTTDVQHNVSVPIDPATCTAPGYQSTVTGTRQSFDTTATPAGWTVSDATDAGGWEFDDPGHRGNNTGGTGNFAMIDSDYLGIGNHQDTVLTSPVADLSTVDAPTLSFDTDYNGYSNSTADVDVSVDGGTTWTNVWHHATDDVTGPSHVDIPLPDAAHVATVQVRFHYVGTWAFWWEVDNVVLGTVGCVPVHGGLVVGSVTDANTGAGLVGATVSSVDVPAETATTAATPDDPNLGDGFYYLFSSVTGSHPFTASKAHYATATQTVSVAADYTARGDFSLGAGQITVSPTSIDKTVNWAGSATAKLTLTNTGDQPATVTIGEQPGSVTPLLKGGAPLHTVKGTYSPLSQAVANRQKHPAVKVPADVTPADAPWTTVADYPTAIQDNLVGVIDGKVYSVYGYLGGTSDTADLYAYDPDSGAWSQLASASDTREAAAGGVINGKLYAVGGWGASGDPDPKLEIYDPVSNAWSTGADSPAPTAGSGSAVLDGKLYVVGGCLTDSCGLTGVEVYNPAANSWTAAADYPETTSWTSCGAIAGKLYCAGGSDSDTSSTHTYQYDPGTNAWTPRADLPADLWASGYTAANGMLLVSGGVTADSSALTNQGYAYDPATDAWTALPNANDTLYRGGSACGFYRIGGSPGGLFAPPVANSEVLPGFTDCAAPADVSWLSESPTTVTLQPGKHTAVTVTLDASGPEITQPGTFAARLTFGTDTPYPVAPVDVTMTVKPPKTWGKITGTVSTVDGKPIAGATVQIDTWASSYTLKTDAHGQYALWLDVRNNPLQIIVAKDGYQPQVKTVKIVKGATTTLDFSLKAAP